MTLVLHIFSPLDCFFAIERYLGHSIELEEIEIGFYLSLKFDRNIWSVMFKVISCE